MQFRIIPRDNKFFDLLESQSLNAMLAAALLKDIVENFNAKRLDLQKLRDYERESDLITHEIIDKINRTFVTPFDREDIHLLAKKMGTLVDVIQKIGHRLVLFGIDKTTRDLYELVHILAESTTVVSKTIASIRSLKNPRRILDYCAEINNLENLGDHALENALENLFTQNYAALDVIKWKEIYEYCEAAINRCEDISNVIEEIVVKYG